MNENKTKAGDRVRYFPNIWDENDFHDGTVIDNQGNIRFDDGYQITIRVEEDGVLLLSSEELEEIGVSYDEQNSQFTSRTKESGDAIAYALAHNRYSLPMKCRAANLSGCRRKTIRHSHRMKK